MIVQTMFQLPGSLGKPWGKRCRSFSAVEVPLRQSQETWMLNIKQIKNPKLY